jgi:Winged helix-turn helix
MGMAQLVVTAVLVEGRSKSEVARTYGVSRRWVITLVQRFLAEGEADLQPRSRRPRSSPGRTPQSVEDEIIALRKDLDRHGHEAFVVMTRRWRPSGAQGRVPHEVADQRGPAVLALASQGGMDTAVAVGAVGGVEDRLAVLVQQVALGRSRPRACSRIASRAGPVVYQHVADEHPAVLTLSLVRRGRYPLNRLHECSPDRYWAVGTCCPRVICRCEGASDALTAFDHGGPGLGAAPGCVAGCVADPRHRLVSRMPPDFRPPGVSSQVMRMVSQTAREDRCIT